jgi:hypothetical protein
VLRICKQLFSQRLAATAGCLHLHSHNLQLWNGMNAAKKFDEDLGQRFGSGDAFRRGSLRYYAAAAALATAQAFDELGHRCARLDAEADDHARR